MKILLMGSDPECFILNKGKLLSSYGLIGGSKTSPRPLGNGFFVQEDNVMAEFNIPPSPDKASFVANLNEGKMRVLRVLPSESSLSFVPSALFSDEELSTPGALLFGCEPDNDAYSMGSFNETVALDNMPFRFSGGHVHVGVDDTDKFHTDELIPFVQSLDLFLAIPSLLEDEDDIRRDFYGKLGRFRYKSYGVEYRTLSNYWVASDEKAGWLYDNVKRAEEFTNTKQLTPKLIARVRDTYESLNRKEAEALVKEFNLL